MSKVIDAVTAKLPVAGKGTSIPAPPKPWAPLKLSPSPPSAPSPVTAENAVTVEGTAKVE
jgi:hypothetical protein